MSKEVENPFRWVPSLQHIAKIKSIEVLWAHSSPEYKVQMKQLFRDDTFRVDESPVSIRKLIIIVIDELATAVRTLQIPKALQPDLISALLPMMDALAKWLIYTVLNLPLQTPEKIAADIIDHFVDNVFWRNLGCIDRQRMYKSYVSDKERIPFEVWGELCFYCLEDDIIKFAKTMDWNNCREYFESPYAVYWYHKIYGKYPTKEMIASKFRVNFELHCKNGKYNGKNMLLYSDPNYCNSFDYFPRSTSNSAIQYFRNYVKDKEFDRVVEDVFKNHLSVEVNIYLLRTAKKDTWCKVVRQSFFLAKFWEWPGILFIDGWIFTLETIPDEAFQLFFTEGPREFAKIDGVFKKKVFDEQFAKIWCIFHRRFSKDTEAIYTAFWNLFSICDLTLCKIMFENLDDHQRILLMKTIRDFAMTRDNPRHIFFMFSEMPLSSYIGSAFDTVFYNEVLKDGEEKEIWLEIRNVAY